MRQQYAGLSDKRECTKGAGSLANEMSWLSPLARLGSLLLIFLLPACARTKARPILRPAFVGPVSTKRMRLHGSALDIRGIHASSPQERSAALARRLADSHPSPTREILSLHEFDDLKIDTELPELPIKARETVARLRKSASGPGADSVLPLIFKHLHTHSCPIRPLIALVLGPLPGADVYQALRVSLSPAEPIALRSAAAAALAFRSELGAPLELVGALGEERLVNVASRSIVRLANSKLQEPGVEEAVLKALARPGTTIRGTVRQFELAATLKLRSAGPLICRSLTAEAPERIAEAACCALERIPGRFVVAELRRSLSLPQALIRAGAVRALAAQRDLLSLEDFRRMARRDTSATVRESAIQALGDLRDIGASEIIRAALLDPLPSPRIAAMIAAGDMGLKAASPSIRAILLRSTSDGERVAAAKALGQLKDRDPATKKLLTASLGESKSKILKRAAMTALGEIGDEHTDAVLIAALNSEISPKTLLVLARAARNRRGVRFLGPLQSLLRGERVKGQLRLQMVAMLTCFQLGDSAQAPRIIALGDQMVKLIEDPMSSSRLTGREILTELAGRDFGFCEDLPAARRCVHTSLIHQWWTWRRSQLAGD